MTDMYMDTLHKLEAIKETIPDNLELGHVLTKLLSVVINQYQLRLERYTRDLRDYEERYSMDTPIFHERFSAGELGDSVDFFEWDGLYELQQNLTEKILHLDSTL
jgi:hypothetical protein